MLVGLNFGPFLQAGCKKKNHPPKTMLHEKVKKNSKHVIALKFISVISFIDYSPSQREELLWAIKTIVQNVNSIREKKL